MLYPLVLKPVFKDYIWGGTRLKERYRKQSELATIAESWELALHAEGVCGIANGAYAGKSFEEYLRAEGAGVLGSHANGELPLLVKLIDTADSLSVQVHPGDEYAMREGCGPGKTEFWHIVDCAPGAALYYGFSRDISREEFLQKANDGSITEALNRVPVQPGDSFLIEPGTVHAIGKDMTVAEIGTNCNITYRIYDFGRTDAAGNPRPLHLEKAADVFRTNTRNGEWQDGKIDCGPFCVKQLDLDGTVELCADDTSFHCLMCIGGSCALDGIQVIEGDSVFVPAGMGKYSVTGGGKLLVVTV